MTTDWFARPRIAARSSSTICRRAVSAMAQGWGGASESAPPRNEASSGSGTGRSGFTAIRTFAMRV